MEIIEDKKLKCLDDLLEAGFKYTGTVTGFNLKLYKKNKYRALVKENGDISNMYKT